MNKKIRVRAAIALAIGTALLFPVASSAQVGTLITEAAERLDQQARRSLRGYSRVLPPRTGALAAEDRVDQPFSLKAGQQYGFLAIGDREARDVDLEVLDSRGNVVFEDKATNRVAVARFRPRAAGRYVVRTIMFECREAACEYALGTYRRR